MSAFEQAFAIVVGHEGTFCSERSDPGNWSGGVVGKGELRGTRFGISAAAYPTENIVSLTSAAAERIYRRDYWDRITADSLPPALALLVFDAAVNNGTARAVDWLQTTVGAEIDGRVGPGTLVKVRSEMVAKGLVAICTEFQAQRLVFMAGLPTWRIFGLGWARRLSMLPYQAMTMAAEPQSKLAEGA